VPGSPPNFPGYKRYCPYTVEPNPTGTWTGPDLATAQRLIAKTGTKGARVTVRWSSFLPRETGSYVVSVLRTLGYRANLKLVADQTRHFSAINDSRRRTQAGASGWIADYPTESAFISVQLTCKAFVPGSVENLNPAQFCDPKIDAQVARAQALQTTDPQAAGELWAKIDRQIVDQAPWVPLFNSRSTDFVSERVGNYQHHPQWGVLASQLWVR
jgi:ABC-type transport system substrate-binding protein